MSEILDEILRHAYEVGPWFNFRCKCGHIENTVSHKNSFDEHLAEALNTFIKGLAEEAWNDGCIKSHNSEHQTLNEKLMENPYKDCTNEAV